MSSKIEWTDETWNPIRALNTKTGKVGWHCVHASEGCRNCYAEGINLRLGTGLAYKPGFAGNGTVKPFLDEKVLMKPLKWRNPRDIFPCSMTDMLADFVEDEWIEDMVAVMALCPHHFFQILTKRPENAEHYLNVHAEKSRKRMHEIAQAFRTGRAGRVIDDLSAEGVEEKFQDAMSRPGGFWPLANVSVGVSVEDQPAAMRVPPLLWLSAAVRVVSAEPLLGPLDLTNIMLIREGVKIDALRGLRWTVIGQDGEGRAMYGEPEKINRIDQVIIGGESGMSSRPCAIEWVDSLVEQCRDAGVACFVKQLGAKPTLRGVPYKVHHSKGGEMAEWLPRLRVRERPAALNHL